MKKPPPKTAKKKPAPAKKKQPKHHHHLTAAQAKHRQQARIKTLRHQLHLARHPAAAKKPPKARKPRGLPLGEGVACCAAQALAASLELCGHGPVSDAAVLALHEHAGGSADTPVTIWDALMAACAHGLDGARPAGITAVDLRGLRMFRAGLVLGLELPGPHAVTVAPDGCWLSWGEHHDPAGWPGAVVEEAWAVTW